MDQSIGLRTVSELLGKNFFIPSYQRGFRWDTQQVEDLLSDIDSFAKKLDTKGFYCLQPIVVKLCDEATISANNLSSQLDDNRWYEVVDGQQRLTTLSILISYLAKKELGEETLQQAYGKTEFRLEYETRPNSSKFLMEIIKSNENIDFFFIANAYSCIQSWFEKQSKPKSVRDYIFKTLVSSLEDNNPYGTVQIIWYELEKEENPIDSFVRINMGKIPLNNAELVKALFLQTTRQGVSDYNRIEIANEWDRMEYALQNEDFWGFLNPGKMKKPARIEFLFDLICEFEKKNNPDLERNIGKGEYSTFRYFNTKFPTGVEGGSIMDEWKKVKDYYSALEDWFSDPVWYHYIGFLVYCGVSIEDIYFLYKNQKKDAFSKGLIEAIRGQLKDIVCSKTPSGFSSFDYEIDLAYKKPAVKKFLLLFNIQYIVNQYVKAMEKGNAEVYVRFPFHLFTTSDNHKGWDVEHISSQTENRLENNTSQVEWLAMAEEELEILKTAGDDDFSVVGEDNKKTIQIQYLQRFDNCLKQIRLFLENASSAKPFPDLYKEVTKLVGEDSNESEMKDSIGNLTLLDAETNRSYGNSLFTKKRRIIIDRDSNGEFIPVCTKNVFLKYFDTKGMSPNKWTENDMRVHQNYMGKTFDVFMSLKERTVNE
jgi:hypothetical protein